MPRHVLVSDPVSHLKAASSKPKRGAMRPVSSELSLSTSQRPPPSLLERLCNCVTSRAVERLSKRKLSARANGGGHTHTHTHREDTGDRRAVARLHTCNEQIKQRDSSSASASAPSSFSSLSTS